MISEGLFEGSAMISYQQTYFLLFGSHTHTHRTMHIRGIEDTGQCVDPALYGFQHAPLGGHVLLGRHGNTKEIEREMSSEVAIYRMWLQS